MNPMIKRLSHLRPRAFKQFGLAFYVLFYAFFCMGMVSIFKMHIGIFDLTFFLFCGLTLLCSIACFAAGYSRRNKSDTFKNSNPAWWQAAAAWILMFAAAMNFLPELGPFNGLFIFPVFIYSVYLLVKSRKKASADQTVSAHQKPSGSEQHSAPKKQNMTIHPIYQQALDQLAGHMKDLEQREASVSAFLDVFFQGSAISKSRYLSVIQNAKKVLENNYECALRAAGMFGSSLPTQERQEMMQRYVSDSADVMNKIDRVIDQLIMTQQSDVLSEGDILDSLLDDLAATTSYYQKSRML